MPERTSDGRPVASRLAAWDEVAALVRVMGTAGAGIFQIVEDAPPPEEVEARDRRMIELAVETRVPFALAAVGSTAEANLALVDRVLAA